MEYIVSNLRIVALTKVTDTDAVEERLVQLIQMEEERFIAGFHKNVEKQQHKAWHDRNIRTK